MNRLQPLSPAQILEAQLRASTESTESLPPTLREMWLAYGDWLLERGDGRGMAISLYDRLTHSRLGFDALSADERTALWRQYAELSRPSIDHLPYRHAMIERKWHCGFVRSALFRGTDGPAAFAAISEHPAGALLSRVQFREITREGVRTLATTPGVSAIVSLTLQANSLGDAGVAILSASTEMNSLIELDLSINYIGDRGAAALAEAKLPHLSVLSLGDNEIGVEGAKALAATRTLLQLTALDLRGNTIRRQGRLALEASDALRQTTIRLQ